MGLVEPIWRYQDACAIGLLLDQPASGRCEPEDDASASERELRVRHVRHVRVR